MELLTEVEEVPPTEADEPTTTSSPVTDDNSIPNLDIVEVTEENLSSPVEVASKFEENVNELKTTLSPEILATLDIISTPDSASTVSITVEGDVKLGPLPERVKVTAPAATTASHSKPATVVSTTKGTPVFIENLTINCRYDFTLTDAMQVCVTYNMCVFTISY